MSTRESSNNPAKRRRLIQFGALGVVVLAVAAFAGYWFLFRDTSAASVNTAEAAEARQAAIEDAAASATDEAEPPASGDTAPAADDAAGDTDADAATDTEVDVGQPDAAASIGSTTDGTWQVDTTIGTFDATCLTGACGATFAGFRINEELAGIGAKTVVGRTPGVNGSMELSGSQVVAASFVVDMTGLVTDDGSRTNAIRSSQGGLETNSFPEAIFVLSEGIELGEVPAEGTSVQVDAVGDLTVHGVTRSVTIPLTAELQAGLIVVFGNLEDIVLADFGIPKPTAAVVLSVEEVATMELQLFFSR